MKLPTKGNFLTYRHTGDQKTRLKVRKAIRRKPFSAWLLIFFQSHRIAVILFLLTVLFVWVFYQVFRLPKELQVPVNSKLLIHLINQSGLYKARPNEEFQSLTLHEVTKYIGKSSMTNAMSSIQECSSLNSALPEEFDARQQWPECFFESYNNGRCSSSWATATASMLSNRLCIKSPSNLKNIRFSPQTFLSCDTISHGCDYGANDAALHHAATKGINTVQCFPYTANNTSCTAKCSDEKPYYISAICAAKTPEQIKQQIYTHGPVLSLVMLYDDFLVYGGGGVYRPTMFSKRLVLNESASLLESVTVVGWGTDRQNNTNYWIIQAHYGPSWGYDGGYAKIAMEPAILFTELSLTGSFEVIAPTPVSRTSETNFVDDAAT